MPEPQDRRILVIDGGDAPAGLSRLLEPHCRHHALALHAVPSVAASGEHLSRTVLVLLALPEPAPALRQLAELAPGIPVLAGVPDGATLAAQLEHALAMQAEREALQAARAELERSLRELREDEEAGRRVQQRILPESPRDYGHCRIEHRVLPSLYLSGDFVDHFAVGDERVAFYLADVSGHGTSSAFVTLLLKTLGNRARRAMQRELATGGRPRASLLAEIVNRELLTLGLGKHVTLFCGILDSGRRELLYSVAGHYPQPIVFDGKCAEYLPGKGMPAGLFDEAEYEDRMLALPAGFALVLLSDGLMELMSETSLADKEARLLQVVGSGAVTVEALSREFALDARRDLPDDVAMLVIRDAAAPA